MPKVTHCETELATYMTVDPGFGGTGWALWAYGELKPLDFGVIHISRQAKSAFHIDGGGIRHSLEERSRSLMVKVGTVLKRPELLCVQVEWPQLFASGRGMASAARGDLGSVYLAAAMVAAAAWHCGIAVNFLPVNEWKGQLSKEQVEHRVCRALKCKIGHYPNHALDAVGMGLHLQGKL